MFKNKSTSRYLTMICENCGKTYGKHFGMKCDQNEAKESERRIVRKIKKENK